MYPAEHVRITLIHGTWAQDAPWTRENSLFCRQLRAAMLARGKSVTFTRYMWSGLNTHAARREAVQQLLEQLGAEFAADTTVKQLIIAHSHGGNVALGALRRLGPLQGRIAGVVAMATPFLRFERERLDFVLVPRILVEAVGELAAMYFGRSGLLLILAVVAFPVTYPLQVFQEWTHNKIFGWILHAAPGTSLDFSGDGTFSSAARIATFAIAAFSGVALGGGAYCAARGKVVRKVAKDLRQVRTGLLSDEGYVQPERDFIEPNLLVLSSAFDEALGALSGAWWIHRTTAWTMRVAGVIATAAALGLWAYLIYMGFRLLEDISANPWFSGLLSYGLPVAFVVSGAILLMLLAAVIRGFGAALRRVNLGLRLDDPQNLFLLTARALRIPGLRCVAKRYSIWEVLREGCGWLFHSRIYAMRRTADQIADWVSNREVPAGGCAIAPDMGRRKVRGGEKTSS